MKVILSTPSRSSRSSTRSAYSPPPSPLTAGSRLSLWRDFLELSPGKALAKIPNDGISSDRRRNNFFDYVSALMLVMAMCLFVAFVVWIAVFTKRRADEWYQTLEEDAKEDQVPRQDLDEYGRDRRPFSYFDRD